MKEIHEYLANKLFPKWFNNCANEVQIDKVFKEFCSLCEN